MIPLIDANNKEATVLFLILPTKKRPLSFNQLWLKERGLMMTLNSHIRPLNNDLGLFLQNVF